MPPIKNTFALAAGFLPLGGKARNFKNLSTGQVISRRQFDKQYGLLKAQGFTGYAQKSNKAFEENPALSLSRPARGRSSLVKVPESESKSQALIERKKSKARRKSIPEVKLSSRMLEPGRKSVRVNCEWSFQGFKSVVSKVNLFPDTVVFAYFCGGYAIDPEGMGHWITLLPSNEGSEPFRESDFLEMERRLSNIHNKKSGYSLDPIHGWVGIRFDEEFAQKNALRIKRKKKPRGLK